MESKMVPVTIDGEPCSVKVTFDWAMAARELAAKAKANKSGIAKECAGAVRVEYQRRQLQNLDHREVVGGNLFLLRDLLDNHFVQLRDIAGDRLKEEKAFGTDDKAAREFFRSKRWLQTEAQQAAAI